jgi:hypothetical protein
MTTLILIACGVCAYLLNRFIVRPLLTVLGVL